MEKLYRKKENGRYESVGYNGPEMTDGIWIVQSKPGSRSISSVAWKVGDLKRPVDITTHAAIQTMSDEVAKYIGKLQDIESKECKEAMDLKGGYIRGPIQISNISNGDLGDLILRKIAMLIEEQK